MTEDGNLKKQQRPRGARPKPPEQRRGARLGTIQLLPGELMLIERAYTHLGVDKSTWIRETLLSCAQNALRSFVAYTKQKAEQASAMDVAEFDALIHFTGSDKNSKTTEGCALVLLDGMAVIDAAKMAGVERQSLTLRLEKLAAADQYIRQAYKLPLRDLNPRA